jgi:hypothetical protein
MKRKPAAPTQENWADAKYPFDRAECGSCLTLHARTAFCGDRKHAQLRAAVQKVWGKNSNSIHKKQLRKHYRKLLAIRRKFNVLWPKP